MKKYILTDPMIKEAKPETLGEFRKRMQSSEEVWINGDYTEHPNETEGFYAIGFGELPTWVEKEWFLSHYSDYEYDNGMMSERSWKKFVDDGMLLIINQFLHVFGYVLTYQTDRENKNIVRMFPARTKFRGFSTESTSIAYKKISTYMKNNADQLNKEAHDED